MVKNLLPTSTQRSSITSILDDDIKRCPFGHPLLITDEFRSRVELLVHKEVKHPLDLDISQAIPDSPTVPSLDGRITLVAGGMAVGGSLSVNLSTMISEDNQLTLLVPHAYAVPSEIASLQEDFDGNVVTFSDNVYIIFRSDQADPEIVRRAFASMIGCYSVAWLFDDAGALTRPVAAMVSIFDGDGFALMARSRTTIRNLFPNMQIPPSH